MADIGGTKKYSPPRDCTKSVRKVVSALGFVGSRPDVKRAPPAFWPMIGSNPGVGSLFPKMNLKSSGLMSSASIINRYANEGLFAQNFCKNWNPLKRLD